MRIARSRSSAWRNYVFLGGNAADRRIEFRGFGFSAIFHAVRLETILAVGFDRLPVCKFARSGGTRSRPTSLRLRAA